jgi:Domain of unknown function (DUF4268)
MFKRHEAARIQEEFWTTFGRYLSPVPSAGGIKINWINYKTGVKDLYFRMQVNRKAARIAITLEHPEPDIRELYFQQMEELKPLLHTTLEEEWTWQSHDRVNEEKVISSIYKELSGVSVVNKDHWPELISFFKPRIIALDQFWENAQYSFEALR